MLRDETRYQDARSLEFPKGIVPLVDLCFGLEIEVPQRFMSLPTTFE
jgi:hypothetical protein